MRLFRDDSGKYERTFDRNRQIIPDEVHVNVYELERNYGGPEEGGWFYDSGFPVKSVRVKNCVEAVDEVRNTLRNEFTSTGNLGSVLHSLRRGCFDIHVEDKPAEYWPQEAPHYE